MFEIPDGESLSITALKLSQRIKHKVLPSQVPRLIEMMKGIENGYLPEARNESEIPIEILAYQAFDRYVIKRGTRSWKNILS